MATPQELFKHVRKHLKIDLQDQTNNFWITFASYTTIDTKDFKIFLRSLTHHYPSIVLNGVQPVKLLDSIFLESIKHAIRLAKLDVHTTWLDISMELFRSWTIKGTYDISTEQAHELTPSMHDLLFNQGLHGKKTIQKIVYMSPKLWTTLKKEILSDEYIVNNNYSGLRLIHRHEPNLVNIEYTQKKLFYAQMCSYFSDNPLTLLQVKNIFIGPHNNALAWTTALDLCNLEDTTTTKSWMQMLPIFSSLYLDPTEPVSWNFWHILSEATKYNDSGQELMISLASIKKEMSQSFSDIWSIVDTLEEGDARYMRAAQMQTNITESLTLPETDSYYSP